MKIPPNKAKMEKALRDAQERVNKKENQFHVNALQASNKRKVAKQNK